jgi:uncharacterized protein involved in outer membrane biogenesis
MRKRTAIILGIVLVLVVGVVLALPWMVDVNRYHGRVQAELQERLERPVSLGRMHLSLLPLGIRVENAVVGEDPAFQTGRPFAQAEELYVSPRLMPLLRREFELRSVELRRPQIELVRNAQGAWNFATVGGEREPADEEPALVLHNLVVNNGQVAITDLQKRRPRAVYGNIDLRLENYAPGRAFNVLLGATLPGEGAQRISIRGNAGPIVPDEMALTPFEGSLRLDQVSISGLQRFLEVKALEGTDSVISGSADLRNQEGRMSSKGSLRLEQTRARGVSVGYPITAEYDLGHDFNTEVLTIREGTLRLDKTPLSVTGTVNLRPETPEVDLRLTAQEASLAEAARLASAFGVAFGVDTRVSGRMQADVRARGAANRPALDGNVRLRDVQVSGKDIPQPVRVQAVDLALTPREIRSNDFYAATGGTSVGVRFTLAQYTSETPTVDANVRTSDADLGEMLNVARAWGADAAEGMRGSGRITLDVRASGPFANLSYSGSGSLREATLEAPAITQPLRVQRADLKFSRNAAMLQNLAVSAGKTNAQGNMTVRNFSAPQVEFTLSADRIDVAELQALLAPAGQQRPAQAPQAGDSVLLRTTGSGTVRVDTIVHEQLVLNNVETRVTLERGIIRLQPVSAELFGGRHRGSIVVDARRTPATFTVASEVEQVDANRLVSSFTNLRDAVFGALMSSAQLNFSADGAESIARTLNGELSLNLVDGRIANVDVMHEISNIARFVRGQPKEARFTEVARMSGKFNVTDGVARTDDLQATLEGGSMGASGTVNLVNQSLNLRLITVLSREFTQRVGGTEVGGFMTTALANQQGELVVPVIVTGTLQQPRFAPDVQRIAEMRLQNLVPSLRNPQQLTTGILGAIGGRAEDGRTPPRTVEGIMDAITGREREPQQQQQEQPQQAEPQEPQTEQQTQPQPRDPARQVQDALQKLLGPRQQEQKPQEDHLLI